MPAPRLRAKALLLLCCWAAPAAAQPRMVWAAEATRATSRAADPALGPGAFAPEQACGAPDAPPGMGPVVPQAWTPRLPDAGQEELRLAFAEPVDGVRQIVVHEALGPGALHRVYLESGSRAWLVHEVHRPHPAEGERRWYRIRLDPTPYAVTGIRLVLRTDLVPGVNAIDAVGVSPDGERFEPLIPDAGWTTPGPRERLPDRVNSRHAEVHPLLSPDGERLYVTRKDHPRNAGSAPADDVWVARRKGEGWGRLKPAGGPVNGPGHDYLNGMTPDGALALLASTRDSPEGRERLYTLRRSGEGWGPPEPLELPGLRNENPYAAFHLGADGRTLLLSIERPDGLGLKDLYVAFRGDDGRWGAPRSLGPDLNTVADETTPYLAADGRTLIFTTNGRYGYGGSDLFVSRRLDGSWTRWSPPLNLGPVINTPGWDAHFSLSADGTEAYLTAVDPVGGSEDVYCLRLAPGVLDAVPVPRSGLVLDGLRGGPLAARVFAGGPASAEGEPAAPVLAETAAGDDGRFRLLLPPDARPRLWAERTGWWCPSVDGDTIRCRPVEALGPVVLPDLDFAANADQPGPGADALLRAVAGNLRANPDRVVELAGHTNALCDERFCLELSERRARAVRDRLVALGVAPEQLRTVGHGKDRPRVPGVAADALKANQRVELRFLDAP